MSLARAFTTRRNKFDPDTMMNFHLGRAASQRAGKPIRRDDISGPVALISTTNMLSYEAPNIAGTAPIAIQVPAEQSIADSSSGDESDRSTLSISTNHTVTDNSSLGSPVSSQVDGNHLSCYFKPNVDTTASAGIQAVHPEVTMDAPSIPKRVLSHSKRAHEHVHRKRTIQRMMSPPPTTIDHGESASTAHDSSFVGAPKEHNPFGSELRQLDEVAGGYVQVARSAEDNAEVAYLQSRNLAHLAASEYLSEIQSLIYTHLAEEPAWI